MTHFGGWGSLKSRKSRRPPRQKSSACLADDVAVVGPGRVQPKDRLAGLLLLGEVVLPAPANCATAPSDAQILRPANFRDLNMGWTKLSRSSPLGNLLEKSKSLLRICLPTVSTWKSGSVRNSSRQFRTIERGNTVNPGPLIWVALTSKRSITLCRFRGAGLELQRPLGSHQRPETSAWFP